GLLAEGGRLVEHGDNREHAILGNSGPAKFVSASRIAPALIALGAQVRFVGPGPRDEAQMPVETLYQIPASGRASELTLLPGQLVTHVMLPPADGVRNATYEVRHGAGADCPLASAAAALDVRGGVVRS